MGACFSVNLKAGFASKESEDLAASVLNEFVHSDRANFGLESWVANGGHLETFDDFVKVCLACHQNPYYGFTVEGAWHEHENDFDASYGWEGVMIDMFELVAPYLMDGSEMIIDIDEDYDGIVIEDGKCIQKH